EDQPRVLRGADAVDAVGQIARVERQEAREAVGVELASGVTLLPGLLVLDVVRLDVEDELVAGDDLGRAVAVERLRGRLVAAAVAAAGEQVHDGERRRHAERAGEEVATVDAEPARALVGATQDLGAHATLLRRLLPEE